MTKLFKPDIPDPKAQAPAPTVDDARLKMDEQERRRMRKGRSANELVEKESSVSTAAKTLTGN